MISWITYGLQDANSPVIEEILFFHDFRIITLILICSFVGYIIVTAVANTYIDKTLLEAQWIERIWTIAPIVILLQLAIPSIMLLYIIDERVDCDLTIKAMGHQWYWTYEYSDFWDAKVDSSLEIQRYMEPVNDIPEEGIRLLDVDNRTVLPFAIFVRVLVSSTDVLHSWAVPTLGVKVDASPGRLNQVKFISHRPGVYFGQCSEICGVNHRFIPIVIELVGVTDFLHWVFRQID